MKSNKEVTQFRYQEWLDDWALGQTIKEIAFNQNYPLANVTATISQLRRKYGWFPHRSGIDRIVRPKPLKLRRNPSKK